MRREEEVLWLVGFCFGDEKLLSKLLIDLIVDVEAFREV